MLVAASAGACPRTCGGRAAELSACRGKRATCGWDGGASRNPGNLTLPQRRAAPPGHPRYGRAAGAPRSPAPGLSDPPTKRSRGGPSGTGVAARSSDVEKEKAVRKALSSLRNRPSQGQPAALAELKAGLTRSMARAVLRSRRQPRARREQVVGSDEGRSIFRRRALRRPFFSTCRHGSRCTAKPSARLPA